MTIIDSKPSENVYADNDVELPRFDGRSVKELTEIVIECVKQSHSIPLKQEDIAPWSDLYMRIAAGASKALSDGGHIGAEGIVDDPKKLN